MRQVGFEPILLSDQLRKFASAAKPHAKDWPVAAVRFLAGRCGAASSNRSFVHRAAFSEGEGRQSGLCGRSLRLHGIL